MLLSLQVVPLAVDLIMKVLWVMVVSLISLKMLAWKPVLVFEAILVLEIPVQPLQELLALALVSFLLQLSLELAQRLSLVL